MPKFKLGDRVFYTSGSHGVSSNNPLKGTSYEMQGTVVDDSKSGYPLRVQWDNDQSNTYTHKDLAYVGKHSSPTKLNPNAVFRRRKQMKRR